MGEKFEQIAKALFHLAQVYELCGSLEAFKKDTLYMTVLLELADKLIHELSDCVKAD